MPLFDGNLKIDRIVITDNAGTPTEVDVARIGVNPVFPDTVGAPVIDGFSIDSTETIPNTGTTRTLTVTGSDDATFDLSVNAGTLDSSSFTITNGSNSYVWTIPAQEMGASARNLEATLSASGITIIEDEVPTSLSVSQEAGVPFTLVSVVATGDAKEITFNSLVMGGNINDGVPEGEFVLTFPTQADRDNAVNNDLITGTAANPRDIRNIIVDNFVTNSEAIATISAEGTTNVRVSWINSEYNYIAQAGAQWTYKPVGTTVRDSVSINSPYQLTGTTEAGGLTIGE